MGTVAVKWVESQLMVGVDSFGHPLVIGSWPEKDPEWAGQKASDLLLLSAASCTAYDVVMILSKQREPLEGFEVEVRGEQDSEPPHRFNAIHVHYRFRGNLNPQKVERAIRLSEEKYCSVLCTIRPVVELTSSYDLEQAEAVQELEENARE